MDKLAMPLVLHPVVELNRRQCDLRNENGVSRRNIPGGSKNAVKIDR